MQVENLMTLSRNFSGEPDQLLIDVRTFLQDVSAKKKNSRLHLVHALVFSSSMSEQETFNINHRLSEIYKETGFSVLGGDTSSGNEFNVFISTIVY